MRLAVKAANDTLGPNGRVTSRLVYRIDTAFPVLNARLLAQRERREALETAKRELATIIADLRIQQELRSKLPPGTRYDVNSGDGVLVYREDKKEWMGPYRVTKMMEK